MNEEIQRKTAKNEWENDDSDFLLALCSLHKKNWTVLYIRMQE